MRTHCLIAQALLVSALCACSTPQVALDQANNGVRLTQSLQTELSSYQRSIKLAAARRLKSIELLEAGAAHISREQAYEAYLLGKSGKDDDLAARERLRDASNTFTRLIVDEEKARVDLAARLSATVKEVPVPSEKLGTVQKAMAELGAELTAAQRVAVVTKFLDEAKAIVDKNAKAAQSAASAPAPAASAGT